MGDDLGQAMSKKVKRLKGYKQLEVELFQYQEGYTIHCG